jgi:hypothetical protein
LWRSEEGSLRADLDGENEMDFSEREWKLVANSGREQFCGSFIKRGSNEDGLDLVLANVSVIGEFWLDPPFANDGGSSGLETVFSVSLPHAVLRKDRIEKLLDELEQWLLKPKPISLELAKCRTTYQSLVISLGVREDLISSLERPACTISYSSNSFEVGKWHFVVDQSCIRIFHDELRASFDSLYSTPSNGSS